jgi:phenylacetate-CoA ligase
MRRMEKVTGRSDDMIILRGVNVFPTQIEEKLLNIPELSMHYQIVLTRSGRMDEMEVHVEARPEFSDTDARRAAANRLESAIKDTIGISCRVVIRDADSIERSAGKARRILDRRPQG